jgi:hypothetical protein
VTSHDGGTGKDAHVAADTSPSTDAHHVDVTPTDAGFDQSSQGADGGQFCATKVADPASGVFVLAGFPASASCGDAAHPCPDLTSGISALAGKSSIYLGPGTYPHVSITQNVAILGGWNVNDSAWAASCDLGLSVISDAVSVTVNVSGAVTVTLDTLTINNATTSPAAGESLYGVFSTGSNVTLSNVSITVAAAGDGAGGGHGTPGGTAPDDGGCPPMDGGAEGTTGTPGPAGSFGSTGYVPGTIGGTGTSGWAGRSGARGGDYCKTVQTNLNACTTYNHAVDGGGCAPQAPNGIVCSPVVNGGCGGVAGTGGGGGAGGGSSIGVYASGGSVSIHGSVVAAGPGGMGGAGGTGGGGGAGAAGITARPGPQYLAACHSQFVVSAFTCQADTPEPYIDAGSNGTEGDQGGQGGTGGGGAGGDSYGYYASGATVTVGSGVMLSHGTAGLAGTPNGMAGVAANHN